MRPVRIRLIHLGFLVRAALKLMLGFALLGALAGALLMVYMPETKVVFGDTVLDPPLAVAVGALTGAVSGVIATVLLFVLAAVLGLVVPAILAFALLFVAFALALTALCVVGGVALAFSPFLLLGFGCVLLFRALSRRGPGPEPVTYPQSR
jgi:hypothetical protein